MELLEIIKKRRSVREFQKKKIPQEIIEQLIEALIWAPSAGNLQSRQFYFVFNQEKKNQLVKAAFHQDFIAQAPLVVIGCTDSQIERRYGQRGKELYTICDVAASLENMLLLAYQNGLGSCWVGAFDEKAVSLILDLPDHHRPIALVPLGYPAERPAPPPRLSSKEAVISIK